MRTLLLAALLTVSLATPVHALRVQLRARTSLALQAALHETRLVVRGQLTDSRNQPAVDAPVAIMVMVVDPAGAPTHTDFQATTAADGRFEVALASDRLGPGTQTVHVEARFAGSPALGETSAERTLDLQKLDADLELQLRATRLTSDATTLGVDVAAMSGDVPMPGAQVQLACDGRTLLTVRTAGDGRAEALLPVEQLGAPGPHVITVQLLVNDQFNAAQASQRMDLVGAVAVELIAAPGGEGKKCGAEDWCINGRVLTLLGGRQIPSPGAAVGLHVDRQHLGTLATDGDGRFAAVMRGEALLRRFRPGSLGLVARAQVPAPFHEIGWSPIAVLELQAPPSLSGWVYGAALLGLAGLAVAGRLRARRRERALLDQREADEAGLPSQAVRRIGDGGEVSCLLRGCILHGETGRPVAAQLLLTSAAGDAMVAEIDCPDGGFHIDSLGAGQYRLYVRCVEHEVLALAVDLPHDGTFDGCALLPASCRAVVRGTFAASVRRFTGRPIDWAVETPREVEPRWSGSVRRGQGEVRDAVRKVERALYGAHTEADVADAARKAVQQVEEAQR